MAEFLVRSASAPFFQILSQWINRGIIADHGKDFYVEDNEARLRDIVGGAATSSEGFVICFLKVPLACLGSMAAAVQPNSLGNFKK